MKDNSPNNYIRWSRSPIVLNALGALSICIYFVVYINVYLAVVYLMLIFLAWYGLTSIISDSEQYPWDKERIWITGGTNGVGKALIELLYRSSQGQVQILLLDCEEPNPKWLATFEGHVEFQSVDLSKLSTQIEEIQSWILQSGGPPTILINNAGTMVGKYLTDLSIKDIQRVLQVNLVAPIILTKSVLPFMLQKNHGHVIHVASACGLVGLAWLTDYCASKFGLVGFNEALRQELSNTNVKTSVICPAQIGTRLFSCTKPKFPWICPMLTPEQVAHSILKTILKNTSQVRWLPMFVHTSVLVKAVPTWLNDWSHRIMGANELHPPEAAPY